MDDYFTTQSYNEQKSLIKRQLNDTCSYVVEVSLIVAGKVGFDDRFEEVKFFNIIKRKRNYRYTHYTAFLYNGNWMFKRRIIGLNSTIHVSRGTFMKHFKKFLTTTTTDVY